MVGEGAAPACQLLGLPCSPAQMCFGPSVCQVALLLTHSENQLQGGREMGNEGGLFFVLT